MFILISAEEREAMARKQMGPRDLLGKVVKDMVTGFEGLAVAVTDHMYACSRVTVEPIRADKDGGLASTEAFDCLALEIIGDGPVANAQIQVPTVPMFSLVRDSVSGIEGRVVALSTSLYGEPQIGIQPLALKEDGTPNEPHLITERRVEVLKKGTVPVANWAQPTQPRQPRKKPGAGEDKKTGGPQSLTAGADRAGITRGLR